MESCVEKKHSLDSLDGSFHLTRRLRTYETWSSCSGFESRLEMVIFPYVRLKTRHAAWSTTELNEELRLN